MENSLKFICEECGAITEAKTNEDCSIKYTQCGCGAMFLVEFKGVSTCILKRVGLS